MCKITEEMMSKPIGMFHCPITLEMVLPGTVCHLEETCEHKIKNHKRKHEYNWNGQHYKRNRGRPRSVK
jgi:hypothetical protein